MSWDIQIVQRCSASFRFEKILLRFCPAVREASGSGSAMDSPFALQQFYDLSDALRID
jgi:hypothetical protein